MEFLSWTAIFSRKREEEWKNKNKKQKQKTTTKKQNKAKHGDEKKKGNIDEAFNIWNKKGTKNIMIMKKIKFLMVFFSYIFNIKVKVI